MIAVPCAPIGPETSTRSPGSSAAGESEARSSRWPTPDVLMYIASAAPRSTTFVSPVITATPASEAARAIASTSARSSSASRPSSRTSATLIASGLAPAIARSFTVPFTASSPIEPPGKRIGLTTKVSVVRETAVPAIVDRARVGELVEGLGGEGGGEQALDQRLGRLAAGAVGHRHLVVLEPRALGARGLDDLEDALLAVRALLAGALTRPPSRSRARSGRSCSRRRRRPPARPCRSRSRARACRRCRTPCTPRA